MTINYYRKPFELPLDDLEGFTENHTEVPKDCKLHHRRIG